MHTASQQRAVVEESSEYRLSAAAAVAVTPPRDEAGRLLFISVARRGFLKSGFLCKN